MRLLRYDDSGELSLTRDLPDNEIPPYAILSHTWGRDDDETDFREFNNAPDKSKDGYKKLQLCGEQAKRDELGYFWVDTCCIDKTSSSELSKNLNLMFRYYRESTKCYVYLADVSDSNKDVEFTVSRWFQRGWTLQELLAPTSIEFFSQEWTCLGTKTTLAKEICDVTRIPLSALHSTDLSQFSVDERMSWTTNRNTKEQEDKAYCLLGIFGVSMAPRYGEGESMALIRLRNKIKKNLQPTLQTVDDRIRDYYLHHGYLDIERLSGQRLPMDSCFINLGVIHRPDSSARNQRNIDQDMEFPSAFRPKTIGSSDAVTLQTLFEPRKLATGVIGRPKRVVIWGRAGMGKTTLCKKIIHDFLHKDLWQDLYDRVFWLPLRRLRLIGNEPKGVAQMIQEVCFHGLEDGLLPADLLRDTLDDSISRSLFILDGLDEVSYAVDDDSPIGANLHKLLVQNNIIITSRPHSTSILRRHQPDLEFETVGFFPQQVEEFLTREVNHEHSRSDSISAIRDFIKHRPIVQSLVRIPVQLDAICYAWNPEHFQQSDMTMTLLYQAIVNRLWQKDIVRLSRKFDGNYITSQQIQNCTNIRYLMEPEISCLEELAFAGLYSQLVEFTPQHINTIAKGQVPLLGSRLSNLSFLRSSGDLVQGLGQTNHFMHLTFQEFFAAHYFVRHWSFGKPMVFPKMTLTNQRHRIDMEKITPVSFIQTEKYSVQYDIFWRFVTGLLEIELGDEALNRFFKELEAEPYDYLGVVHQRLVIKCLNEVVNSRGRFRLKAQELEHTYQQWTTFELQYGTQNLLRSLECPMSALRCCLRGSNLDRIEMMEILALRPSIPFEALEAAIAEARESGYQHVQDQALAVIAKHCDQLPKDEFMILFAAYPVELWSKACELLDGGAIGQLLFQLFVQMVRDENRDEDPHVTCSVIHVLGQQTSLPVPIFETCVRLLQDSDSDIRSEAAQALENQSSLPESVVEALIQLAQDRNQDFHVLQGATRALGGQSSLPESAIKALVQLLQDQNSTVRSRAAHALSEQSSLPEPVIEMMAQLLQDQDFDVRFNAAVALDGRVSLPDSAIDGLVGLLQEEDSNIANLAAVALECQISMSEFTVERLVQLLQHQSSVIRSKAAGIFCGQVNLPEYAIDALVRLLEDKNSVVRYRAVHGLAQQKSLPEYAIEILIRLLRDQPTDVRFEAARALKRQTGLPDSIFKTLIRLLQDQDYYVRSMAALVVGKQESLPDIAVKSFIRLLQGQKSLARSYVVDSLAIRRDLPAFAVDALIQLLSSILWAKDATRVLEGREELYASIPNLGSVSLTNLLQCWLEACLSYQSRCYAVFNDDTLVIDIDGKKWTVRFEDGERETFKQRCLDAHKTLGSPLSQEDRLRSQRSSKRKNTPARGGRKKRSRPR